MSSSQFQTYNDSGQVTFDSNSYNYYLYNTQTIDVIQQGIKKTVSKNYSQYVGKPYYDPTYNKYIVLYKVLNPSSLVSWSLSDHTQYSGSIPHLLKSGNDFYKIVIVHTDLNSLNIIFKEYSTLNLFNINSNCGLELFNENGSIIMSSNRKQLSILSLVTFSDPVITNTSNNKDSFQDIYTVSDFVLPTTSYDSLSFLDFTNTDSTVLFNVSNVASKNYLSLISTIRRFDKDSSGNVIINTWTHDSYYAFTVDKDSLWNTIRSCFPPIFKIGQLSDQDVLDYGQYSSLRYLNQMPKSCLILQG